MTLTQIQSGEEIWSLEADDHDLYVHYVADIDAPRGRTVMPITRRVLERMAMVVREGSDSEDERQLRLVA